MIKKQKYVQKRIAGGASNAEIIRALNCSKSSYYNFIRENNIANPNGNISVGFIQTVASIPNYNARILAKSINVKYKKMSTIDDIPERLEYIYHLRLNKFNQHLGQRKLFLTELKFLSTVLLGLKTNKRTKNKSGKVQKYVIYAGSSPGNKNYLLRLLFPTIKFIFVDPNEANIRIPSNNQKSHSGGDQNGDELYKRFQHTISHRKLKHPDIIHLYANPQYKIHSNIYKNNKKLDKLSGAETREMLKFITSSAHHIYLIEDFMTNNLADTLARLPGEKYFISDIRSNVADVNPTDYDILWNSSMMYNWIYKMQPEWSMIKFRPQYVAEKIKIHDNEDFKLSRRLGLDFIKDYNSDKFKFSQGAVHIQPWQGLSSTETRLWIEKKNISKFAIYSPLIHEEKLFFYNNVMRNYGIFPNANMSREEKFCCCGDCHIENETWCAYLKLKENQNMKKDNVKVLDYVRLLNLMTNQTLSHRHIFSKFGKRSAHELYCMFMAPKHDHRKNFGAQLGNTGK
jgi:hypothetical protein